MNKTLLFLVLIFLTISIVACTSKPGLSDSVTKIDEGTYLVQNQDGKQLKITAYGDRIIRLQSVRKDEAFFQTITMRWWNVMIGLENLR